MGPIVFLHIPKTAGQATHRELVALVDGEEHVSPIRVHTQARDTSQLPAGYRLYSGHIDWTDLESLPQTRFAFTIFRDPRERIASFYLYLLKEAQALGEAALAQPENRGKQRILTNSADDYFFSDDLEWQSFIHDHYNNFYCTYLATRKIRGYGAMKSLSRSERLRAALDGAAALDGIFSTDALEELECELEARFGARVDLKGNYFNRGSAPQEAARWPLLMKRLERDSSRSRLENFADLDLEICRKVIGA